MSTLLLRGMLFLEHISMSNLSSAPTLKALRETPTACIYAVGASAASLVELLGAVLGNPDTALAVLNQFPTLEDIAGIGKSSIIRTKKPDCLARLKVLSHAPAPQFSLNPRTTPVIFSLAAKISAVKSLGNTATSSRNLRVYTALTSRNKGRLVHAGRWSSKTFAASMIRI